MSAWNNTILIENVKNKVQIFYDNLDIEYADNDDYYPLIENIFNIILENSSDNTFIPILLKIKENGEDIKYNNKNLSDVLKSVPFFFNFLKKVKNYYDNNNIVILSYHENSNYKIDFDILFKGNDFLLNYYKEKYNDENLLNNANMYFAFKFYIKKE